MRVVRSLPPSVPRCFGVAELFNLLINPLNHDFALRWHRDDVRENATAEEELKALASWSHGVRTPPPPRLLPASRSSHLRLMIR